MKMHSKRLTLVVGLFFAITTLAGCATYQNKVSPAREALRDGDYPTALKDLELLAEKQSDDQLVYLLDYGVAQQVAGKIDESTRTLLQAEKLSELVDYHSVSRIAGSLALSEEVVQYKGDTFEKIFINAYLAMNFLEQGKLDDALVEARRINEKYLKYRADEKQKFELNAFSKYLSAMIWEASRSYDDAYIAYNETYKIDPTISTLPEDLIRSAKLARRPDAYKEWKKAFPQVTEKPEWSDRSLGELVVIYQQGWGPRKTANRDAYSMPMLVSVPTQTRQVRLTVEGKDSVTSRQVYNVDAAARATLKEDYGLLVAKRLAGVATKEVLADQVRQKNEALGAVAWILLFASDRADVRQWSTLPETIQTARIYLKPGKYKMNLQGLDYSGNPTTESLEGREVEIKAGQKKFVIWRSLK